MSISNLASLYEQMGHYRQAGRLFKQALEASERVLGKEHPDTFAYASRLALVLKYEGRYGEAETLYKRAIEGEERTLSKDHPITLATINNLALLYQREGRYEEAGQLLKRALDGRRRVLGADHLQTLITASNLALLYEDRGLYGEAGPLLHEALETAERVLGKEHPDTLLYMSNLANLYRFERRYSEGEQLCRRAIEAEERVLGKEHPQTLQSVKNLAELYRAQGRYAEAEPVYLRAIEGRERALGKEHPQTLASIANLAELYFAKQDWFHAAQLWRRSSAGITRRTERTDGSQGATGKKASEAELKKEEFSSLVKAEYRLAVRARAPFARALPRIFETAQWALSSEAAQSLAQMAARGAARDPSLAVLARERQDLIAEWQKRDQLRDEWLGRPPDKRSAEGERENNARLAEIASRIDEISQTFQGKFPDYAAFARLTPLSVAEVQAQLGSDEALMLFLDKKEKEPTPEETFIWVVTKADMRWVRSDLGTAALAREVQALRCGLDATAWEDQPCAELTGRSYTAEDRDSGKALPFVHARSYRLYQALFGQVEDLVKGKSLLIVASGPLTKLPFQVLETAPDDSGSSKLAAWLIRDHALTVLPAVSSLKALRRVSRPSAAPEPMIGFGNPLLDGPDSAYAEDAQNARDRQRCGESAPQRIARARSLRRGIAAVQTRGELADAAFLRMQVPLPETADELCAVARDVHADPSEIYLGARATELEVKRLSESGRLAQFRIVHFATHGALAGEVSGNSEPGLLMTPPEIPSEGDDGYLTASEIAGLKLDADWVILSACNTAAGGAANAEALSGLARAFIYAQARALLVSHWEVNSDAAVKLITGAMRRLAAKRAIGRAEAMRQSMLDLIDRGEPSEALPANWAPFVVVGEGGAGR